MKHVLRLIDALTMALFVFLSYAAVDIARWLLR